MSQIIGLDESGRGALAGSMYGCAYIRSGEPIKGMKDHKLMTAKKRLLMAPQAQMSGIYAVCGISPATLDFWGIQKANIMVLAGALRMIKHKLDVNKTYDVIVDGELDLGRIEGFNIRSEIKADQKYYEVQCAGLVAKYMRDLAMGDLDAMFKGKYAFRKHKGYGTKGHYKEIKQYGTIPGIHRESFLTSLKKRV